MSRRYLFVHQNFPGQFVHVARALADIGAKVAAIGEGERLKRRGAPHPKILRIGYPLPKGAGRDTHPYLRGLEAHTRRGQAVFRAASELSSKGFTPDVVIAHPGWGEALFLRDVFPDARHIQYLEFFYGARGADVGFDPEFPDTADDRLRVRIKNATQLVSFEAADSGVSPTAWQRSRYPESWQSRIAQIHDGIDTEVVRPNPHVKVSLGETALTTADEVVTFVARNLEPYRGIHTFMRAVPEILERRPSAVVLILGGDQTSYGRPPVGAPTHREKYMAEWGTDVDRSRVHFLGHLQYAEYLKVLQISALHVYLTYPFVLSWSMLEAMSAGCLVLASSTQPVTEVIDDGVNGWLTDFFDSSALAKRAAEILQNRNDVSGIRNAGRQTIIERFDLKTRCLPQMLEFLSRT